MREILFRGKRVDNGEWAEGEFCSPSNICGFNADNELDDHLVLRETVGQFIGLTDKNGKKIFVGDILRSDNFNFVVKETRNGWGMFRLNMDGNTSRLSTMQYVYKYDIIGTIFDKETSK